ncbi:MAG: CbbQ/NirQ/NorQ/GpvN family protein [Spirosoma sp.]|nr:CbbQ/NirQ/NorQ/GpvN family protein [Spirosoma sp.]
MTQQDAHQWAQEWIRAFNAHDLNAILDHYADELAFYSPLIPLLTCNESGCITSKDDLERYFRVGLSTYPDLHFTLQTVFVGIDTLVIQYTSVNARLASEVVQLNEQGKAQKVFCHYAMEK